MTKDDWDHLEQAIGRLSTIGKHRLIERLNRSIRADRTATEASEAMTTDQKEAIAAFIAEMEALPPGDDAYAGRGYGNEAHDRILYDLEQR
jgi:hypothetical protein